jgi:hypothetical protein
MPDVPGVLNFPTLLDTVISLIEASNNASASLVSGINGSALAIPVTQPSEFTNSGIVTIMDVIPNPTVIEIVNYTSKSGSDLVVPASGGRGQQGTSAQSFSAGAIVEQRPTARHVGVLRDAIIEIEKKIGYGAPLGPLDASGTNAAGNNYDIHGGRGTGNAVPGVFGVRFPLVTASGATLQALSTNRVLPVGNMYTNTTGGQLINSSAEVSMFSLLGTSNLSFRAIEGGSVRAGTMLRLIVYGSVNSTGTPTLTIRTKYGATTLSTIAGALANNTSGHFTLAVDLHFQSVGAAGSIANMVWFDYAATANGAVTPLRISGSPGTVGSIDTTTNKDFDLSFQFSAASSSNFLTFLAAFLDRIR